jgi:hypothetical protein
MSKPSSARVSALQADQARTFLVTSETKLSRCLGVAAKASASSPKDRTKSRPEATFSGHFCSLSGATAQTAVPTAIKATAVKIVLQTFFADGDARKCAKACTNVAPLHLFRIPRQVARDPATCGSAFADQNP